MTEVSCLFFPANRIVPPRPTPEPTIHMNVVEVEEQFQAILLPCGGTVTAARPRQSAPIGGGGFFCFSIAEEELAILFHPHAMCCTSKTKDYFVKKLRVPLSCVPEEELSMWAEQLISFLLDKALDVLLWGQHLLVPCRYKIVHHLPLAIVGDVVDGAGLVFSREDTIIKRPISIGRRRRKRRGGTKRRRTRRMAAAADGDDDDCEGEKEDVDGEQRLPKLLEEEYCAKCLEDFVQGKFDELTSMLPCEHVFPFGTSTKEDSKLRRWLPHVG